MNIYDLFDSNKNPSKPTVSESRIEIIHEFAVAEPDDSSNDDMLFKYARMWWNGDSAVQRQVETILGQSNWGIGEVEDEDGGAFVVQNHDENGDSYTQWTPEELSGSRADEDTDLFTSAGLNGVAATQDSDNVASPIGSGVEEAIETIRGREYPVDPGSYYVWAWDGAAVIYGEYNTPEQAEMHLPHIEQKAIKRVGPYVKGAFRVSDGRNLLRRYGVAVRDVEETAPLSRDARRELVAPTDRDTIRRELWKYVRSLDQEGSSNRAHAMAHGCPTWGRLYRQFNDDISQLLSRAPTELLAQALQEIQSKFQGVAEGSGDVVQVHQHQHGKDMGKYGAFNIERETPTVIVVYDHNTGEMLKFNRVTGRGIGPASQLMIRQGVAEGYVDRNGPIENTPQVVWWRKTQGGNNIYWKVFPTLSTASRARENLANSLYKKYGKNFTMGNAKFDPTDPAQCRAADADRYMTRESGIAEGDTPDVNYSYIVVGNGEETVYNSQEQARAAVKKLGLGYKIKRKPRTSNASIKKHFANRKRYDEQDVAEGITDMLPGFSGGWGMIFSTLGKWGIPVATFAAVAAAYGVAQAAAWLQKGHGEFGKIAAKAMQEVDKDVIYKMADKLEDLQNKALAESTGKPLSVEQLATISDEALDAAYHYGRSTPGNTFGWQANLKSAAYAKKMIDAGETDIEKISDAIHRGWNVTAQAFIQNPMIFDDSKTMAPEKLQAKIAQRQRLVTQNYAQLPEEEKEKDRVVARAMLQAITGDKQDVAEAKTPAWLTPGKSVDYGGRIYKVQKIEGRMAQIGDETKNRFKVPLYTLCPAGQGLRSFDEDSNMPVAVDSTSPIHGVAEGQQLHVGDPVIITGSVEFNGATGDIVEFGRGQSFVVVDLYNYGKHSFHTSNVEYNKYADDKEEKSWHGDDELDIMENYLQQLKQAGYEIL